MHNRGIVYALGLTLSSSEKRLKNRAYSVQKFNRNVFTSEEIFSTTQSLMISIALHTRLHHDKAVVAQSLAFLATGVQNFTATKRSTLSYQLFNQSRPPTAHLIAQTLHTCCRVKYSYTKSPSSAAGRGARAVHCHNFTFARALHTASSPRG